MVMYLASTVINVGESEILKRRQLVETSILSIDVPRLMVPMLPVMWRERIMEYAVQIMYFMIKLYKWPLCSI